MIEMKHPKSKETILVNPNQVENAKKNGWSEVKLEVKKVKEIVKDG